MNVSEYLSEKYNEEMIIKEIGFYDGFYAEVFPAENTELIFKVSYSRKLKDYYDSYLSSYLEYDFKMQIKQNIDNRHVSKIIIMPINYGPELREMMENKYAENHKPPTWNDLNIVPEVQDIRIYFDEIPTESELNDIVKQIYTINCNYHTLKFYEIKYGTNNLMYEFTKQE